MANAAVFIKWGTAIVGRETKSLEVFGQALDYHQRLKKEGKIAAHHTFVATTGDTSQFGGFIVLEGEIAQLRAAMDTDEWQALDIKARNVVTGVDVIHCIGGNEIPKFIEQVVTARKQIGITT
jgi:hypothetical protein